MNRSLLFFLALFILSISTPLQARMLSNSRDQDTDLLEHWTGSSITDIDQISLPPGRLLIVINKNFAYDKNNQLDPPQTLTVIGTKFDGSIIRHNWFTSTGIGGRVRTPGGRTYETTSPKGFYTIDKMNAHAYSRTWNVAMPFAMFILNGMAIHASKVVSKLGRPASHGCIRLEHDDAQTLFGIVQDFRPENTRVWITKQEFNKQ